MTTDFRKLPGSLSRSPGLNLRGRADTVRAMGMDAGDDFIRNLIAGKADGQPPRILLVEDDKTVLTVLERCLDKNVYSVTTAGGGKQAIERINAEDFDLVVTDIMMPEVSGMDVLKLVKSTAPDTEVILMTGQASIETAIEALRLGAADYILKPFVDLRLFQVAVRKTLTRRELIQLARQFRGFKESAERLLRGRQEKYENLGEVTRVCVSRTIETLRLIEPRVKGSLSQDEFGEFLMMKGDNEELLALLDSFLELESGEPKNPPG